MATNTPEAFVYCWTDKATNKLYVGSHKGQPNDGYVCSSRSMLKEHKQRPADFSRQIIAWGTFSDMRKFEEVLLKTCNAALDEGFYNLHNNDGKFYFKGWFSGEMSAAHRQKIAEANRKRAAKGITAEHARKLHEGRRKSKNSPEHIAAVANARRGTKHSEKTKQKMSEVRRLNPHVSKLSEAAGLASAQKRKESGYYQSEQWKLVHKKAWETRRKNRGG